MALLIISIGTVKNLEITPYLLLMKREAVKTLTTEFVTKFVTNISLK